MIIKRIYRWYKKEIGEKKFDYHPQKYQNKDVVRVVELLNETHVKMRNINGLNIKTKINQGNLRKGKNKRKHEKNCSKGLPFDCGLTRRKLPGITFLQLKHTNLHNERKQASKRVRAAS